MADCLEMRGAGVKGMYQKIIKMQILNGGTVCMKT
jgi:hypothetical protein